MATKKDVLLEDLESENLTHWEVTFEVKVDKESIEVETEEGEEPEETDEIFIWLSDTITVRGGEDGLPAVDKVKSHVLKKEDYGLSVSGFKLTGLKIASQADI